MIYPLYADRGSHCWYTPEVGGRVVKDNPTQVGRALAGITDMAAANRFLRDDCLPRHIARSAILPKGEGSAFVPFAGVLEDSLCIQEVRIVGNDNTVRYRIPQIPADRHRHLYVKARVHEYPDGRLAVFHGPRCLARYDAGG